jgi:predicted Zn-dependent peptidase
VGEVPEVKLPTQPRLFLLDQPGAVQANIYAVQLVPSSKDPGQVKLEIANSVLGGEFSSRLNMNLREDKHWAYGSYSGFSAGAIGQRPWRASAAVQIDKTSESIAELQREITDYVTGKAPPKPEEVAKIQATEIRGLPGAYETAGAVMGTIGGIVRYDRPDDYVFKRKAEIESLTVEQVAAAARTIDPKALTWIVVGDLSKIEQPVRALKLAEVTVLDAEGKPVGAGKPAK